MKEKTALLIMDGYQVALIAIMLVLITVWIIAHLFAGHFNFIGFIAAGAVWYIIFGLFCSSIRDYKATKNQPSKTNEK